MENIAKSTSYGCYLDCDFETAKYPDDKTHIVGLLAEYVYDLEQRILHYDERYIKLWNEIETLRECVSKEFDQEQKIADLEAKLAESESELEKQKEKYDKLYGCYKKTSSEDLQDKYSLAEENEQLKKQIAESEKKFIVANNLRKNSDEVLLNYKTKKYGLDKTIEELRKMKLSLPEKEWYYKGFENCERQMSSHIADLTLEVKQLKQQLHDLPNKIVTDFYDEIRHRAILEDDYCPDHNLERKYGVRKCLLENIKDTILKKYGGENESE